MNSIHTNTTWYDNTHIKTSEKKKCMICKKKTDRLDMVCEGFLCSVDCDNKFYKMVAQHEHCNES